MSAQRALSRPLLTPLPVQRSHCSPSIPPPIWSHLDPLLQQQLASLIAELLQRVASAPSAREEEKHDQP
jgi:hypothetical protein